MSASRTGLMLSLDRWGKRIWLTIYLYFGIQRRVVIPQVVKHIWCIAWFHSNFFVACLTPRQAVFHNYTLVIFLVDKKNPTRLTLTFFSEGTALPLPCFTSCGTGTPPSATAQTENKATQAVTHSCCVTLFSFRATCGDVPIWFQHNLFWKLTVLRKVYD